MDGIECFESSRWVTQVWYVGYCLSIFSLNNSLYLVYFNLQLPSLQIFAFCIFVKCVIYEQTGCEWTNCLLMLIYLFIGRHDFRVFISISIPLFPFSFFDQANNFHFPQPKSTTTREFKKFAVTSLSLPNFFSYTHLNGYFPTTVTWPVSYYYKKLQCKKKNLVKLLKKKN